MNKYRVYTLTIKNILPSQLITPFHRDRAIKIEISDRKLSEISREKSHSTNTSLFERLKIAIRNLSQTKS